MPTYCCARGCGNRHIKGGNLHFFSFQLKNVESVRLWLKAIRRENFTPSPASRVCSAHFLPSDYLVRPGAYIQRLKPDAVPSIFKLPHSWEKKLKDVNDYAENGTISQVNAEGENVKVEADCPVFEPEFVSCNGPKMQTKEAEPWNQIYAETKQEPSENPLNLSEQLEAKVHLMYCKDEKEQINKCGLMCNADCLKRTVKVLQQKVRRQPKMIKRLRNSVKQNSLVNIGGDIQVIVMGEVATLIVDEIG